MRFAARLLGLLFVFIIILFVSRTSFAQTNLPQNNAYASQNKLSVQIQNVLIQVMGAAGCQLAGINPANPNQPCLIADTKTGGLTTMQNNRGLLGFTGNMISVLYTPPAHTADYFRYLAGNFGISKGVYAQNYVGVGLRTISPIGNLWVEFRNIVYLIFVLVFVVIGIAIMLRVRIDPRTVMTIQNQIPKLVIGIILVTLSFPIAGFLIDIMWVVILLVTGTFIPLLNNSKPDDYISPFGLISIVPGGILGVAGSSAGFLGSTIFSAGFDWQHIQTLVALPANPCSDIVCILGGVIEALLGAIIGFFLSIIIGMLAFFVIVIALLYALLKLWFELLKAYISILIDIIFAPFWIVAGMLPGANEKVGFGPWVRDILGNLMAFPVAIGMFFLASFFARKFAENCTSGSECVFFLPPLVGNQGSGFGAVLAFGLIMMTPNAVKIARSVFKSPTSGFGGINTTGFTIAGAIGGAMWGRAYRWNPVSRRYEGVAANAGRNLARGVTTIPRSRPIMAVRNSPVGRATGAVTNVVVNNPVGRGVRRAGGGIAGAIRSLTSDNQSGNRNTSSTREEQETGVQDRETEQREHGGS